MKKNWFVSLLCMLQNLDDVIVSSSLAPWGAGCWCCGEHKPYVSGNIKWNIQIPYKTIGVYLGIIIMVMISYDPLFRTMGSLIYPLVVFRRKLLDNPVSVYDRRRSP